eukprot:TRINITY_DN36378_c0_g1_i1.p1 TRINITY_DN36378_c0_g1~~TRINITY_DN36378_c0_g1_i1.p1  ORF type:complete len:279 (+),score=31.12 TRINITY_DN36378_c0_g1_i1:101-937(+)
MALLTKGFLALALALVVDSSRLRLSSTRRLANGLFNASNASIVVEVVVDAISNATKTDATDGSATLNASDADGRQAYSACPDCPCSSPRATPPLKWSVLQDVVEAFNALEAPYNIHGGTLLGLRRGCNIFDTDIDFVVDGDWLFKNSLKMSAALKARGFHFFTKFGVKGQLGYEEAWNSALQLQSSSTKAVFQKKGIKVDVFTAQRFRDHYIWNLWVKGKRHPCTVKSTGTAVYKWKGLAVRVPVPVDAALASSYGQSFLTPQPWTWNKEPFTVGSCK